MATTSLVSICAPPLTGLKGLYKYTSREHITSTSWTRVNPVPAATRPPCSPRHCLRLHGALRTPCSRGPLKHKKNEPYPLHHTCLAINVPSRTQAPWKYNLLPTTRSHLWRLSAEHGVAPPAG